MSESPKRKNKDNSLALDEDKPRRSGKGENGNMGNAKVNPSKRDADDSPTNTTLSNFNQSKSGKKSGDSSNKSKSSFTSSPAKNGTPGPSILKKGKGSTITSRSDTAGVPIVKGGKRHKIKFKENIVNVQFVENWKEYNADMTPVSSCHCNIF